MKEKKKVDEIIQDLMKAHYRGSPIEFRLSKVFRLNEKEKRDAGAECGEVYLFWGFISLPQYQPDFLFGQFSIHDNEELRWGYRRTVFNEWAKKARRKGWFDRADVREESIDYI